MENLLLKEFYSIRETNIVSPEKMIVKVELHPGHPVYEGHFPQIPVAPGVCLVQMIKEVVMLQQKKNLLMTEGDNIKFMALVNPQQNPFFYIDYEIGFPEMDLIEVSAHIRWEAVVYLKFKGKFKVL